MYWYLGNLLKIIATTGAIFSLQFAKNRLEAGLGPDPLGELERSSRPLAVIRGPGLLLRGKEGKGGEGKGGERREGEKKGGGRGGGREREGRGKGREGKGKKNPMNVGWLRACYTFT